METGLVLALPGLDPALRRWRKHDPAARAGMPAHVTLIYPFMDSRAVDEIARARMRGALTPFGPIELRFERLGGFPGGVWLEPAEPGPIVRLIEALAAAFPDHPPYGGAYETVIPHLTIAQGPAALVARMGREAPKALPLSARAEAVSLYGRSDDGWIPLESFALVGRG
ncbi:MAG: 2'-5' RNA ligase family protein [Phenylobacterium sp.]|uniref:2'-5' RNA ligase family protein n=1 Tax=Phenylobacterium sp. TaxID=1871053 RepID=UPI00391A2755